MPDRLSSILLSVVIILVGATQVTAQYNGYRSIADLPAFKKKFAQESSKVMSITSDFTQDKTLMALTEKISSSGKFWFKRNDRVRIEYLKPFTYLMIINGDKMMVRGKYVPRVRPLIVAQKTYVMLSPDFAPQP